MLKPRYIEQLPDRMIELYSQLEMDILADMARRISTYDFWIPAAEHQRKVLIEMGNYHSFVMKALSSRTKKTRAELERLMMEAGEKALSFDAEIYQEHGLDPPPLAASKELQAVLRAGLKKTRGLFTNLTRTTANTASKQFENALDRAYMQITSGAFDSNTAIRMAIKDLSKQGVGTIRYPSGRVDTIETAVRRAVVTGVNQTALQLQDTLADEMGSDLVETTAHAGARPEHAEWQGKIFSRSGKHPKYPDFRKKTGYGTGAGLGGWNCRHSFFPYFEGSPRAYTEEMLRDFEAKKYTYNGQKLTEYEATQTQRHIERQIRRWKREYSAMAAAGLDTGEAAVKISRWKKEQREFIAQTGLKRQFERERTVDFTRKDATQAKAEAEKRHAEWLKSIGAEKTVLNTLEKYFDAKYNNSPEYLLLKQYSKDVESGWLSPLSGFEEYKTLYQRIETEIVGRVTAGGTLITGQVPHFMQRVIGTAVDPKKLKEDLTVIRRSGVLIDDIKDALFNPEDIGPTITRSTGQKSVKYIGAKCAVAINPVSGLLIQTNPRRT